MQQRPASAFEFFLRTGLNGSSGAPDSFKFNPWHDPEDGRFTYSNQGRFFGPGSSAADAGTGAAEMGRPPKRPGYGGYGQGKPGGAGASGAWNGGGASGTWIPDAKTPPARTPLSAKVPTAPPPWRVAEAAAGRSIRHVRERNGHRFGLDERKRTRLVSGTLRLTESPQRSRYAQANAGKPHRLPRDDGGHYVAARFDGPTDKFNHFAQDRNFNRGAYRVLEDSWTKELSRGRPVDVRIIPTYETHSQRPSSIIVAWKVGGRWKDRTFQNSPGGGS